MKRILILLIIGVCISSCQKQKPSPRQSLSGKQTETSTSDSRNKIAVPYHRTTSGLAEVQVSLNGVPFNMWWDTGASMTSISTLEFAKLIKEGKISDSDYVRTMTATIADGTEVEENVYQIKELYLQGENDKYIAIRDIYVSVADNLDAPLLLGQNAIQQFPSHTFNETKMVIEFDSY